MGPQTPRAMGAILPLCSLFMVTPASGETAPIWTGAYAGLHGGVTWAELDPDWAKAGVGDLGDVMTRDGIWGLHAGYNIGKGRFVVGIEGDVNFGGFAFEASTFGIEGSYDSNWSGSVRARFGMTAGPALFYGTVGYAHSDTDLSASVLGNSIELSETLNGVVYGAGVEGFVLPNASLRVEALRYEYSSNQENLREIIDPSETVLRAGVTFHFN